MTIAAAAVPVRFRLGAEELVELGRLPPGFAPKEPYLAGRQARAPRSLSGRTRMGDISAAAEGFVVNALGKALSFLEGTMDLPDFGGGGALPVRARAEGLLKDAPGTGLVMAQALLLGSAVLKFAVTVPEEELRWLGGTLSGLAQALSARFGEGGKARLVLAAREALRERTPARLEAEAGAALDEAVSAPPEVPEAGGSPLFPAAPAPGGS